MVNTINELQKRNKNLLEENENLKQWLAELADKNQEQQWIATILSKSHYTDNPDVDVVGEIMRVYCDQEKWAGFCKLYPTEPAWRNLVLNTYQYYPYYKQSNIHWGVRNKAKRDIFINLRKRLWRMKFNHTKLLWLLWP